MPRDWLIIALGAVIAVVGIWRGGRSVHIRKSKGNIIGGDASGTIAQTYTNQASASERPNGDRVAWVIAVVGILVAVVGIVFAHLDAGH
jgi:hypothetical protein